MRYFLSLGSNLGNRRRHLARALGALGAAGVRVSRVSSVYRTQPVDFAPQPWFYNLALEARSALTPAGLLSLIERIEREMGRVRVRQSGPRTIDIDILLAGSLIMRTPRLTLPHPRLAKRNFVLVPLAEIAPAAVHPVFRKRISSLLKASMDRSAVRKLRPLDLPKAAHGNSPQPLFPASFRPWRRGC
jgi:2-amino-4-hydroxy-6-hydroxymethyldihydropteridine diphosphokinase